MRRKGGRTCFGSGMCNGAMRSKSLLTARGCEVHELGLHLPPHLQAELFLRRLPNQFEVVSVAGRHLEAEDGLPMVSDELVPLLELKFPWSTWC